MVGALEQARRVENWPENLTFALEVWADQPFRWGENDCGLFMFRMVEAMTGIFPWEEELWNNKAAACALIKEAGSLSKAVEGIAERHEWPRRRSARLSQRGDAVVFLNGRGQRCCGICIGRGVVAPGPYGLELHDLERVVRAWEIPLEGGPDA